LWVVPNLTNAFLESCRGRQSSVIDLNGRVHLRSDGLWLEWPALPKRRFRLEGEPRNVFVGKSVRIVRALLADPDRIWKPSELVSRTGATSGLVSRITTHLLRQEILASPDTGKRILQVRVASRDRLLDAWAQADDFNRRTTLFRFNTLEQNPQVLARRIRNVLTHQGSPLAFTQWIAAWLRSAYTEPAVVSLYVPNLPSQDVLDELGLHSVKEGGRAWFYIPNDEGVFRENRVVDNLPLVSDAQIYVDLQRTGLRGPEQAQALREFQGFCRP
jgi:hypothetical protein